MSDTPKWECGKITHEARYRGRHPKPWIGLAPPTRQNNIETEAKILRAFVAEVENRSKTVSQRDAWPIMKQILSEYPKG
jgi:hypothetical protein